MLLLTNNDDFADENDVSSNPNFVAAFPKKTYKKERDEFILCIYDYWKAKRLKYVSWRVARNHGNRPIECSFVCVVACL